MNSYPKVRLGVLLMIISTMSFSVMQVMVRMSAPGISVMQQLFFRNLFALLTIPFIAKKMGVPLVAPRAFQLRLLGRSGFGFLGTVMIFYATRFLSQGDISVLTKMHPFIIVLLLWVFTHKRPINSEFIALGVALTGVFIVANPSFSSNFFPMAIALASSIMSALAYIIINQLRGKVHSLTVIIHFSTFTLCATIPFLFFNFTIPSLQQLLMLLALGATGSLGQILLTYSFQLTPPGEASIYMYLGIIFSFLLGYWVLGEPLALRSVSGGLLVIFAAFVSYFGARRHERKERVDGPSAPFDLLAATDVKEEPPCSTDVAPL